MGVYIKEMDKPKECDECFFDYLQKHPYCDGDISHCPLIEVKTPHGRLIDADALADDLEYDAANEQDCYKANCASWLRSKCNQTVIEAEEGE